MSAITSFLEGTGADHRGRTLAEVIAFEDDELEGIHDYIQWLFPLPEVSAFNPFAPVITSSDIETRAAESNVSSEFRKSSGTHARIL
jgi:hypothetical protein